MRGPKINKRRTVKDAKNRIRPQEARSQRSLKEKLNELQALAKNGRLNIKVRKKAVTEQ